MSGGKGGGSSNTQTIQNADPWAGIQPYLLGSDAGVGIFPEAQRLYSKDIEELYPGQMYVGRTPLETQARNMQLEYLSSPEMATDINRIQQATEFGLGDVLYPESNPAMEAYMDAANRNTVKQLTENILPSYRGAFVDAGQIGSSREAMAEGMAMEEALNVIGDTNAQIAMGGYGQGLQHMGETMRLAPLTVGMDMQIPEMLKAVGAEDRAWMEKPLQEDISRWGYYEGLPGQMLDEYVARLGGYPTGSFGSSSSTTSGGGSSSPLMGALGGAATGAGAFGALTGQSLISAPVYEGGALVSGAGLNPAAWPYLIGGGLLGLF
jgi:hypothetical protein